jgi:hypothetical protein
MKTRITLAAILAVGCAVSDLIQARGGVILIATRKNQDSAYSGEHLTEEAGPGLVSPGDVAMGTLLADHGYSFRLLADAMLNPDLGGDPTTYLNPGNPAFQIDLVIWSGSSASADVPAAPDEVPVMMGEHVTLGNRADRAGSIYMYNGQNSSDPNESSTPAATKYMKVVAPTHPIFQGIPLDDQDRIRIFREPYPGEDSRVPEGGKRNYEYRWCTQTVADAAPGTTVLGVLEGAEDRACFAVMDAGGQRANGQPASARMVHMFTNENGSGGSRRVFLALTPLARLLFLRAAQWALGEELTPYQPLRILDVTALPQGRLQLSWQSSTNHNYRIYASDDALNWQPVADDIPGIDGTEERTLDLSAAPQAVFLQLAALP